ncbi:lipase [Aliiglaciecola sp. CAU 1673]|uniref:VolA/Pla-1 family phospholipase n=1 Tax=Aliiglaciecola sp. CAU 1673 TaxID=3032595 RepID=UPI0023DC7D8E|nr:VolA/Pla-1 family phospholipase [Aliiglaciecola sp. CAU 1673]MDF2179971.1 lipase [Aliiglaciecola sp. CAU 1673]
MRKLLVSMTVAAALGLSGCGDTETLQEAQDEASQAPAKPFARVVFDPTTSNLNVPNDLLMLPATGKSFFDFTLNTEGSATFNPANPTHALSALDGWSTHHPFQIRISVPSGVTLDPSSAGPGAVRIFEATQALEGQEPICQGIAAQVGAPGVPCVIGNELQWGVDFVTQMSDPVTGTINVVPLKPFKAKQGYVLATTTSLKDADGRAVLGSSTWDLAKQDPETHPLGSAEQRLLQGVVDIFLDLLSGKGLNRDDITYTAYFSTQSAGTVLSTVKQLQIGPFAQAFAAALAQGADLATAQQSAAEYLPAIPVSEGIAPDAFSLIAPSALGADLWAQLGALGLNSCNGLLAGLQNPDATIRGTATQVFQQVGAFCAASLKSGTINLPYYGSTTNPLGDWWKAACTNGAMLRSLGAQRVGALIGAGAVGPNNALCQAASGGQLFDLDLSGIVQPDGTNINDPRNLTKVSPIPAAKSMQALNVQMTVPNPSIANLINPSLGLPAISKPASGWPVIIMQHGITSKKEDMLAITGALSLAGFATVAIDHPLHGSRGFVLEGGKVVNASSGFGGATTDYLNLASLLTARDNLRQSVVDIMGLRLGLNAVVDTTGGTVHLDGRNVSFLGHSLGAITGTTAVAMSNRSLGGDLANFDGMYAIKAATLAMPGGGVGGFLLESPSFGPLIKGSLLASSSADFQAALQQYMAANGITQVTGGLLAAFYPVFEANLTAAQKAAVYAGFSSFAFAAQTVIDASDPNNFAALIGSNTPVHMIEVIGDGGGVNLPDQVIPNTTSLPLAGTEPLAALMGLEGVNSTIAGNGETVSGLVRFLEGSHSSILSPAASAKATAEMQRQVATYMATQGTVIQVTDTTVVAQ